MIDCRELADPEFHQWRCLCRHLMETDPTEGAAGLEDMSGRWSLYYRGWNRYPADPAMRDPFIYVYISDDGGITTTKHPDVPLDEIVDGPVAPEFGNTIAAEKISTLTSSLRAKYPALESGLVATMEAIQERAKIQWQWVDRSTVLPRLAAVFRGAARAVSAAKAGTADITCAELLITVLVEDFLNCKLSGRDAASVLSEAIFLWCRLPLIWPVSVRFKDLRTQLDYLVETCHRIRSDSVNLDIPSYLNALRLAALYAWCGMFVARKAAEALDSRPDDQQALLRIAFNLDELQAHYLAGANQLPSLFEPRRAMEWLLEQNDPEKSFGTYKLHPSLRSMFDQSRNSTSSDAETWNEYYRLSASGKSMQVPDFIPSGQLSFLAPQIRSGVRERLTHLTRGETATPANPLSETEQVDSYLAEMNQIFSRTPEEAWPNQQN
jgi:hypothetical protein